MILLAVGCLVLPVSPTARLATLAVAAVTYPVLFDLNLGNISVVVFALTAIAWAAMDGPLAAAAHAILVLLRLPFIVFGALWLFQRRWRMLAQTAIAGSCSSWSARSSWGPAPTSTTSGSSPACRRQHGEHNFSLKSVALDVGLGAGIANGLLLIGSVLGLVVYLVRRHAPRRDTPSSSPPWRPC